MKNRSIFLYVFMGTLLMLLLGIVYSYSLFRLEIEELYDVSKTVSGIPFMFVLLFYSLFMAISGILYERFSSLKIAFSGVTLIVVGFILASYSTSILTITLSYGILIGSGIGILYGLPLRIIANLKHKQPGLLTGITLMGFGLSPLLFAPVIQYLIDSFGLSNTFMVLGLSYLVILIVLIIFLIQKDVKEKIKESVSFAVLKNREFYKIYTLFFMGTFIGLSVIGLTGNIGVDMIGISRTNMAIFISVFSIFNGLGRPLFGFLNDYKSFKFSASFSFLSLILISFLIYLFSTNLVVFILAFIIFYLNFGGWLSLAPGATLNTFGKEQYSQIYGFMFTAYGLGAFFGNGVSGGIVDSFSYEGLYILIAFISLIGLLVVCFTFKKTT